MCEKLEYEGKNIEEIIEKIENELNIKKEQIIIINTEEKGSLFKGKKVTAKIIKKEDLKSYIKEFFKNLEKYMSIQINCEIKEENNIYNVMLVSDNNAIVIGKDGKNLDAIQTIIRTIIKRITNNVASINIDASNYKAKKINNLEHEIKKIIDEVLKTKIDVKLDPMNSYERMIVHNYVSKYDNLTTESIGEEPNRYIVIKYKED